MGAHVPQMMPYTITTETTQDKSRLLNYFRDHGEEKLAELRQEIGSKNYKELASRINKALIKSLKSFRAYTKIMSSVVAFEK